MIEKSLSSILIATMLAACAGDGRDNDGQYAGITFVHTLTMNQVNSCAVTLQSLVNELSIRATELAGKKINPQIVIQQVHPDINATAETADNKITINPRLCEAGITPKTRFIIAHELAHFVANAKKLSSGNSYSYIGNHRLSNKAEQNANNLAEQILVNNKNMPSNPQNEPKQ